jgi:hypothetical protein
MIPRHLGQTIIYFAPKTASFAALAIRNFITFLAGILIAAPVAGFLPMRAFRFTRTSLPSPGKVKAFLASLYASSETEDSISSIFFFGNSNFVAR